MVCKHCGGKIWQTLGLPEQWLHLDYGPPFPKPKGWAEEWAKGKNHKAEPTNAS